MDQESQQFDGSGKDNTEHETHTVALTLLVLVVAAVIGIVLVFSGGNTTQQPPADTQNQETATTVDSQTNNTNSTNTQQSAAPDNDSVSSAEDISVPDALIPPQGELVRESGSGSDSNPQKILNLTVSQGENSTFDYYQSWFNENGFTIEESSRANGLIVARSNSADVAVELSSDEPSTTEIRVNYRPR